jgi:hypothetical protein
MLFEKPITQFLRSFLKTDSAEDIIEAPDFYEEINFDQRCREYKLQKVQKQKFLSLREKFSSEQIRNYIDPFITKIRRNEKDIIEEITKLVDSHIDRVEKHEKLTSKEERIQAVRELYE